MDFAVYRGGLAAENRGETQRKEENGGGGGWTGLFHRVKEDKRVVRLAAGGGNCVITLKVRYPSGRDIAAAATFP